jgi:selT/selW/selH-like putative selenoprotein
VIRTVELMSATGGRFEVSLDGEIVFSKASEKRFPKAGEVVARLEKRLGPGLKWRQEPT